MVKKAKRLVQLLKQNNLTMALAESMTCGLATYKLSKVPDVSSVLRGGVICYHESCKAELLSIPLKLIRQYSAESQQVTDALAKNLSRRLSADISGAITGLASPGGSESAAKPVGTVFFAAVCNGHLYRHVHHFRGTPEEVRDRACEKMYEFLISLLNKNSTKYQRRKKVKSTRP